MFRLWPPVVRAGRDAACPRAAWRSWPFISKQGPAAHGWVEDQVWTAARVTTLIGRKFPVSYSVSGATHW
ncbi:winged helix-turn-helix domain-containing protein [Streptomyces sp. NPDC087538]|uniref:winged helix-turn-helix domain-containing protein n=1 Tax=Streptomyces sp. NPDC087538 TaxID=3365797 RepID=UPI00382ABC2D